ncbi:MAG: DUF4388 domain-containing protein [Gemmatimonadales bacterium]
MAIRGSLEEASLPDVIQLLALGQKSGKLTLTYRNNIGSIFFERGLITFADIVNRRDRLGDTLVKAGRISLEQLQHAISLQGPSGHKKIGEILIEQDIVSRSEIEHYVRIQIEEAVYFLFTWTQGTFNFETGVEPEEQDFLVAINPDSLLLEGARRVDEWSLIEKKLPSFDVVVTLDRTRLDDSQVELTAEQETIIELIDGQRDVQQIIDDSALAEFDVGKALYGLMAAGFVHRSRKQQVRKPRARETQVEEHRNLGLAFYRTGMWDEALREFRRVAELRANDGPALFFMGLVALRQTQFDEAVEYLKTAAEVLGGNVAVLNNLAVALEKSGQFEAAESVFAEAASRERSDSRIMVGWGIVALQSGEYEVAAARLDRTRELLGDMVPPPIWYWARSLASASTGDFEAATKILEEGVVKHEENAVLRNNLAVVLELTGDLDQAEVHLREAAVLQPSFAHVHKNLGDVAYRRGGLEDAWDSYLKAVKLHPALGDDVYFKLGNIAYKWGDRDGAARYWSKVLELNSSHQLARTNLETMKALA